jgi:hypothetical protein
MATHVAHHFVPVFLLELWHGQDDGNADVKVRWRNGDLKHIVAAADLVHRVGVWPRSQRVREYRSNFEERQQLEFGDRCSGAGIIHD